MRYPGKITVSSWAHLRTSTSVRLPTTKATPSHGLPKSTAARIKPKVKQAVKRLKTSSMDQDSSVGVARSKVEFRLRPDKTTRVNTFQMGPHKTTFFT